MTISRLPKLALLLLAAFTPPLAAAPAVPDITACHEVGLQATPDARPAYGGTKRTAASVSQFNTAVGLSSPGDEIEIQDGTYTSDWTMSADGSASEYILIYPETANGVTFSGGGEFIVTGDYVWVEGLRFTNCTNECLTVSSASTGARITRNYFSVTTNSSEMVALTSNTSSVSFDNNELIGCGDDICIVVFAPKPADAIYHGQQNHNLYNNYFHDTNTPYEALSTVYGGGTRNEAQMLAEDYQNKFQYNKIDNACCDNELLSIKNGGWIIEYNLIENSTGAITMRGSYNSHINYNVLNNNTQGIRIHGKNHEIIGNHVNATVQYGALALGHGYYEPDGVSINYGPVTGLTITDNYFVGVNNMAVFLQTASGPQVGPYISPPQNNAFNNNTFWRGAGTGLWYDGGLTSTFLDDNTWTNNNVWRESGGAYTGSAIPTGTGNTSVDDSGSRAYVCTGADTTPPELPTDFTIDNT